MTLPSGTIVIGLDPGITTGYAVLDPSGRLLYSGNLQLEDLKDSILENFRKEMEVQVIMEEVPIPTSSKLDRSLLDVVSTLRGMFGERVREIKPGQWKQISTVSNLSLPSEWDGRPVSQHQKDAYRLAMYYILYMEK